MKTQLSTSSDATSFLSEVSFTRPLNTLDYTALDVCGAGVVTSSVVTITEANPGVMTWTGLPLANGDIVTFTTTGTLPTNLVPATGYFLINKSGNTAQLSATAGGAAIDTTGAAQAGVHTGSGSYAGSAILTFSDIGPSGALLEVKSSDLEIDQSAVTAGMTTHFLHLYNASPTAVLDNAAFNLPSGDRTKYLGSIALGTVVDQGATLFVSSVPATLKRLKLAAGSTTLYGVLQTTGAYAPASGTVTLIRLWTDVL